MPAFEGAIQECARCGHLNLASDQGDFWTQEPCMLRLERLAKLAIALAIAGVIWLVLTGDYGLGTGQGWVAGAPILLGAYLWETARKITRWGHELRAWIVWTVFLIVPGLLGAFVLVGLASAGEIAWPWGLLGVLALLPALLMHRLAQAFERWRVQRILRGAGITAP
jgi:drug/metabolite transporter (DMT)-like permease